MLNVSAGVLQMQADVNCYMVVSQSRHLEDYSACSSTADVK